MAVRVLLLSVGVLSAGCGERESPSSPEMAADNKVSPAKIQPPADEEIAELRREIDAGKQAVEDIEAFVQMERAKLDEDPEYDKAFMLEALHEQEQLKEVIETGEARLEGLTGARQ